MLTCLFLCQEKERLLQDMCGKEEKLHKEREAKDMLAKKIAVSDCYKQSRSFYNRSHTQDIFNLAIILQILNIIDIGAALLFKYCNL